MEHQTKSTLDCPKCDKKFDTLAHLKIHEESHDKTQNFKENELNQLKSEIINEIQGKKKRKLSWGNTVVTVVLVILTLISIAQTVQSINIFNKIEKGAIKPANTASTPLPSSLENLPNMVGGC